MILETVIFTALPRGRRGNLLSLSVFVSPQLGGEEGNPRRLPLSSYPDFANGEWARIVRAIEWELIFRYSVDDADEIYATARRVSPDPDAALAAVMFPNSMPVDPFTFDNPARVPFLSFPSDILNEALGKAQVEVARRSPEVQPAIDALVTRYKGQVPNTFRLPLDPFVMTPGRITQYDLAIDEQLRRQGATTAPEQANGGGTLASLRMLDRFLAPQATPAQLEVPPEWPDLDFHGALSMLTVHPLLLRKLGFIVDLEVDITGLGVRTGTPRVYVYTSWPGSYDPDARGVDILTSNSRVLSRLTATAFQTRPQDSDLITDTGFVGTGGMRGITSDVAVEGQATQTQATGLSRMMAEGLESFGTPERQGLSARRSSGITVVRRNNAFDLRTSMDRMAQFWRLLATGDDLNMSAEDVLAGYRVDIRRRGTTQWRTLHRRFGVLTPYKGREALASIALGSDEGWVEPAGTGDMDEAGGAPLRIVDTLAHWTGWSLAIPQPGLSLGSNDRAAADPTPAEAWPVIDTLHGVIDYTAPPDGAQLPTLRFSTIPYEVRLRWVDLAGNSVPVTTSGGPTITVPYRRHEPVAAPVIRLGSEPVWRESVDVAVIRNATDRSQTVPTTRRYVASPQVSAETCVTHGMFDDASGVPRSNAYATIAARESASLPDGVIASPPAAVPYLPDPLSTGILVRGLPRASGPYDAEMSLRFGGTWPDVPLLALVLDGTARPGATVSGTRMTIGVPPGRVARLRISSALTAQGLELLDLWPRIASFSNADRARLGAYWQLTPDRVLTVVHAVQRPLLAPAFVVGGPPAQRWAATRTANETAAVVRGKVTVDAPSTESLTLSGTAEVAVDAGPGTPAPYVDMRRQLGVLGTVDVADAPPESAQVDAFVSVRAAFDDTRHIGLTLSAEATSRFAEYFRRTEDFAASDRPVTLGSGTPIVAGTVRVTYRKSADAAEVEAAPDQYTVDLTTAIFTRVGAPLPDNRRIPVNALITVTWLPDPISRTSATAPVVQQRQVRVSVPSSARPLPPEVAWIMPTFRWQGPSGSDSRSTRLGGGLRIYLERPWWSSGIGEELAVVLRASDAPNSPADDLVSQWALEATTTGTDLPEVRGRSRRFPAATAFTNRDGLARGVVLSEFAARVDVARYTVGKHDRRGVPRGYDAERDLWFVDVDVDPGTAYRPFLRLALARYQPQAAVDLQLSPVVLVDVVQLEPDRVATMAMRDTAVADSTATITLRGPSYASNEVGAGPGRAVAILERFVGSGTVSKSADSAAWEAVTEVALTGRVSGGQGTWSGTVRVPRRREAGRYRIVIEQYEVVRTDGRAAAFSSLTAEQKRESIAPRLVHQDILPVPPPARR
jgi:autonomous glycyl radical cofactor GrcA